MKAPVNLEALMDEWQKDAVMDETEPAKELVRIPVLHSKYLRIMTHHNMVSKKLYSDYNNRRRIKWEYYSGDLNNPEDLERYNLPPMEKKILRSDISTYLDSDEELNTILLKKAVHDEIVEFCKSVLKEISNRTWQLKSTVDYARFISGQ